MDHSNLSWCTPLLDGNVLPSKCGKSALGPLTLFAEWGSLPLFSEWTQALCGSVEKHQLVQNNPTMLPYFHLQ